jgi:hypothetical protein
MTSLPLTPSGQFAFEHNVNRARNLPPEFSCRPYCGGIRAHNRRAHGTEGAIHIRVGVRSDYEGTRCYISTLDHELMANPGTGSVEIDPVLPGECFDRTILLQVRFVMILYVMVEGEDELFRVVDLLCADRLKFAHHSRRVVMGNNVGRPNGEVSRAQRVVRAISEVGLSNLLDDRLGHEITFASTRSRRLTVIDEHRPTVCRILASRARRAVHLSGFRFANVRLHERHEVADRADALEAPDGFFHFVLGWFGEHAICERCEFVFDP